MPDLNNPNPVAQAVTASPTAPKPESKILLITVLILLVLIVSAIYGTYLVFGSKVVLLPVNPNNSYINNYAIFFDFRSVIKEISQAPQGLVLNTDIKGENIPEFIIDDKTQTYLSQNGIELPIKASSLSAGLKIRIVAGYNPKNGLWKTTKIVILGQ